MQSYNSHDDEVGGNMSLTYDGTYGTVVAAITTAKILRG